VSKKSPVNFLVGIPFFDWWKIKIKIEGQGSFTFKQGEEEEEGEEGRHGKRRR